MSDNEEFQTVENNTSLVNYIEGTKIRVGDVILINKYPCKIIEYHFAGSGKHGVSKILMTGRDIFTGKKCEMSGNAGNMFDAPVVTKTEYQLTYIDDENFTHLQTDKGIKEDLKLPENELGKAIKTAYDNGDDLIVTVINAMNQEAILDFKKDKGK